VLGLDRADSAGKSFDTKRRGSGHSAYLLAEQRIAGGWKILWIRTFLLHVGHYTRDRFDRVSHNETSKHTDYCRRVSLRTANDVVRPQDTRRFVGPDRSSRFSRLTGFCSEWTEVDRVRDAYAADCFPVFTSSPLSPESHHSRSHRPLWHRFCRSLWTTNCWLAVKFL